MIRALCDERQGTLRNIFNASLKLREAISERNHSVAALCSRYALQRAGTKSVEVDVVFATVAAPRALHFAQRSAIGARVLSRAHGKRRRNQRQRNDDSQNQLHFRFASQVQGRN